MRICIVGNPQDLSAVYVGWKSRQMGIEVVELPEDSLGIDWTFCFDDTEQREGEIRVSNETIPFSQIQGAFVRFHPSPKLPQSLTDLPVQERELFLEERRSALHHLLNNLPCTVANRPYAGRSNSSKPFQMRLLSASGFVVPKWLVTNSAATVQEFVHCCRDGAIYKSCSGLRSKVRLVDDQLLQRLRQGTTPIVVQEYIRGRDVRVHTVVETAFATEVLSPAIDYRFESGKNEFRPTSLPDDVAALCWQVAYAERLIIAGFDFRVTDDGRWHCLEVNPVPTFLPYEMATGQPICQALLSAFMSGSK